MLKGQDDGSWSVSLRSRGGTDLARVAMALGGGGHTLAAGYSSYLDREKTIEALRAELTAACDRHESDRRARAPDPRRPRPPVRSPLCRASRRSSSWRPSRCTCWSTRRSSATSARVALGGLAVGGGLLAWAAALLNFLAYGTTARAARRAGAGDRAGAVAEGVQATWLALGLGLAVLLLFQLLAGPLTRLLAGGAGPVAAAGEQWLRIASLGAAAAAASRWPATAGCAACRSCAGRCATCWPAAWSAWCSARCWCTRPGWAWPARRSPTSPGRRSPPACSSARWRREGVALAAPAGRASRAQLVIGRDLLLRAAVLQLSFLVAAGVAARAGTAALGAHQIALQLFFFLALVLDAYAIAAQTLVGHALGADRPEEARATARRVTLWGLGTGVVVARCPAGAARRPAAAVHRRPRRPRAGGGRLVVPRRHAAAGRRRVRPGRRADGRRRRRLPAHGDDRLGAWSGSCRCRCWRGRSGWGLAGVWTGLCLFIALRLVGVLAAGGG